GGSWGSCSSRVYLRSSSPEWSKGRATPEHRSTSSTTRTLSRVVVWNWISESSLGWKGRPDSAAGTSLLPLLCSAYNSPGVFLPPEQVLFDVAPRSRILLVNFGAFCFGD
ncbi:unnamed protein product, partial [Amoebophrya sp. A120]